MAEKDDKQQLEEGYAQNRLSMWQLIVDERIRKAIGDGNMSWHPSAGQPLHLESDEHVPDDQRIAYKIMKDNDAVPAWIALAYTLKDKNAKIIRQVTQYATDYVKRRQDALLAGSFVRERHAQDRWLEACKRLADDVGRYNSELLDYNLQIPSSIPQMVPLNAKELIADALKRAEAQFKK
jgi:hypothetical protein